MSQFFLGACVLSVFVSLLAFEIIILIRQRAEMMEAGKRGPEKPEMLVRGHRKLAKDISNASKVGANDKRTSTPENGAAQTTTWRHQLALVVIFYAIVFVLWGAAGYFFVVKKTTDKNASPAANRDVNQECILADFYDAHCVWHFLSSNALLLSALRAIYLSHPCKYCKHKEEAEGASLLGAAAAAAAAVAVVETEQKTEVESGPISTISQGRDAVTHSPLVNC